MELSKAIYRLSKLSRLMAIDGCEEDVLALHIAVDVMSEKLRTEQIAMSVKHVVRPNDSKRGNIAGGVLAKLMEKAL